MTMNRDARLSERLDSTAEDAVRDRKMDVELRILFAQGFGRHDERSASIANVVYQ